MTDEIKIQTFLPGQTLPKNLMLPQQSHSANIFEIKTGFEDLTNCDGLWTQNPKLLLGVKTADCAPICVWNKNCFGIVHAGWRGVVNGAVENLLLNFETGLKFGDRSPNLNIWIGPILPRFKIQKDECYDLIFKKFGDQFFTLTDNMIFFEFKDCLRFMLPEAEFDERSTYVHLNLASWRRDKSFPNGQNTTVIGFSNAYHL